MRLTRLVLAALAALLLRQEAEDFGEARANRDPNGLKSLEIFLSQFPKYRDRKIWETGTRDGVQQEHERLPCT